MAPELLERIPQPSGTAYDDSYCLSRNDECLLKIDFEGSAYNVSWRSNLSAEEFVRLLERPAHVRLLRQDGDVTRYDLPDSGEGAPEITELPENSTSIAYTVNETRDSCVYQWTKVDSDFRVGIRADTPAVIIDEQGFFRETVSDSEFRTDVLGMAYKDAISEVMSRTE